MLQGNSLKFIAEFIFEEDGTTAVEYAIMLAMIIGVCAASVSFLANSTKESFDASGEAIAGAIGN
ncbi:MAG: Flp family type IVb pilin [Rubripirellula sp.]